MNVAYSYQNPKILIFLHNKNFIIHYQECKILILLKMEKKQILESLNSFNTIQALNLNSLNDLRTGVHFAQILSYLKSEKIDKNTDPIEYLKQNLPLSLKNKLNPLTISNICEIATYLISKIPLKVPKLQLPGTNYHSLTPVSTQRSYLSSYILKTYSKTPSSFNSSKAVPVPNVFL